MNAKEENGMRGREDNELVKGEKMKGFQLGDGSLEEKKWIKEEGRKGKAGVCDCTCNPMFTLHEFQLDQSHFENHAHTHTQTITHAQSCIQGAFGA